MRTTRMSALGGAVRLGLLALLLCLETAAQAAPVAGAALRREGSFMVDADNRVVLLHGVNAVWKLSPYYPPDTAAGFGAADADFLATSGFNVVRLGVLFAGVMPQQGVVDQNYLDQIDRVVQLLAARGIWVLLDFHQDQYNEKYQGEGFPAWAVDPGILPDDARYGFPLDEFLSLSLNGQYDKLWADRNGIWSQYRAAVAAVAARWSSQPYLLGYDLFNEPWPGALWPTCFEVDCPAFDATLEKFEKSALAGVRSADTAHFAFFEPQQLFDFGAPSRFGRIADAAVGLSWHAYCSAELLSPKGLPDGPDCPLIEPRTFHNAAAQAAEMGAVPLLTEFGASDDVTDITRVTRLADQHLVGWTYWAYKTFGDPTGSGQAESLFANDGDLGTLKQAKAKLLIRPYAQAVAGIPTSMSFDPASKLFTLVYTPRAAGAPTVVFVPSSQYPNGYSVSIAGAQVVSQPGAALLELAAQAGATQVRLTLTPAP
ncbi:MAG: cellulase family glycosylhydrolase [Nevskia sp.]|nr:cellulase family glycosylhydrolase [Nevskia sp.]